MNCTQHTAERPPSTATIAAAAPLYVQLPLDVLDDVTDDLQLVLWCVLVDLRRRRAASEGKVTREQLADLVGRRTVKCLSAATAALRRRGLLDVQQRHVIDTAGEHRTRNLYRPLRMAERGERGRPYVELPVAVLDAVAAGRISAQHVRAAAWWLAAAGRRGWTVDSVASVAACYGVELRAARAHRSRLVAAGLLVDVPRAGGPSVTARPGAAVPAATPARKRPATPARERSTTPAPERPPVVPPQSSTSELTTSCSLRRQVPEGDARATVQAPAPPSSPKASTRDDQDQDQDQSAAVVARLPRVYRAGPVWTLQRLAAVTRRRLAAGYGPGALVRAAAQHVHEVAPDRTIPALLGAYMALAADVAAGEVCRDCGQPLDELRVETCTRCGPPSDDVDPVELAAVHAALASWEKVPA